MPTWLILALLTAATCATVILITILNDRRLGKDDDPSQTPDVIEYMTMMVGVVYAIVLGLAIAGVWEARSTAHDDVRQEAQALHEVSARAQLYPAAERDRIRKDVDAYVHYAVTQEWQHMLDHGSLTDHGDALLAAVRADVSRHAPHSEVQSENYQPMVDQVAAADAARTARAQDAQPTMPDVIWFGLALGGIVVIGTVFTLQIRRSPRELALLALFSALFVFLLFLVWDFDAPFGRSVGDASGPFTMLFPHASSG